MNACIQLNQMTVTPQGLDLNVANLDFARLKHKYTESSEAEMTVEAWDVGEREYRRFLSLKSFYPYVSLVPTKIVDEIWHAHILDTRAYREDCQKVFGQFIDHYPYFGIYGEDDYRDLQDAFARTVALYERHFGKFPTGSGTEAMRCADHACHVPTSCACRVPGACK
ncbi:glycine-rich domain-containing protein [Marinobacter nauticus]|jgi:hypothetical protein|uniref:glycine-rich domain-containing protein n=1 Tax=Marinobacter nauticus TaxID=2743 RepID=UPI00241D471B|nr:hypothetical protein [Marinobacter nauticus]